MRVKATLTVTGMSRFEGIIEGTKHDFTKFAIQNDLDESRGNSRGKMANLYKVGTATIYEQFKAVELPFQIDAECDFVTNTRGDMDMTVVSFQLVKKPDQPLKQAA